GDVVALQLPNWTEALVVMLAAARLGAVTSPILPIHRRRELGFILSRTRARVLFIPGAYRDCDHRALVRELRPTLPALEHVVVVREEPQQDAVGFEALPVSPAPAPSTDASTIALLIHTSGTTADPKGVLHSHETLLAEARSLAPVHGLGSRDRVLMPSPLTH